MRTCEAGACTKPAVYRGHNGWKDEHHAGAWCEEHAPRVYAGRIGWEPVLLLGKHVDVVPIPGGPAASGAQFTEGTLPPGAEPAIIPTPKGVLP